MGEGINRISEKINSFKKRYYLNLLIRGSIFTFSAILVYFILASLLEYNLWLSRSARFLIFASFFALVGWCVFRFLKEPLAWWIYRKGLGEEESAKLIGGFFPSVGDKLLNVIQLASSQQPSDLLNAGISQKSVSFKDISFEAAIDLKENKRYIKYFIIPFALILILWIVNQGIFTQSATRIVKFNQEFSPQAPFRFVIQNQNLQAFFNEDFTLSLQLEGEAIPAAAYIVSGEQRWKMENTEAGKFSYTFEKIQNEVVLQIEASGFLSEVYTIQLINRPELTQLKAILDFPSYLNRKPEELTNAGNLEIPEGTKVTWQIGASSTSKATIQFSSDQRQNDMQLIDNEVFKFSKNFHDPEQYTVVLENDRSKNKDQINYSIAVIKDQFPQIVVENLKDSILYRSIYLGGSIADDYGLNALRLNYQIIKGNKELPLSHVVIPIEQLQPQQNFFHQWSLDSLKLEPGDKLSYHFQVWDNDGVNGRKSTRSANYTFSLPGKEELKDQISQSEQSAQSKIDQSMQQAKDLKQSIEEAQQKLRGKQTLDWQDKKMLEDLIKQREKLDKAIDALQKENELLEKKKENFSEESERIKEKSEQIQKLMNELLDDETKKMFQELEKLLKENADATQIEKMLDKIDRKEINLEKELERTLQLFKQMQYDYKAEQAIDDLKNQIEKQEDLLSKTEELADEKKNNSKNKEKENTEEGKQEDSQKLAEDQEELQKEFEKLEEELDELDKLGEELNKQEATPKEEEKEEVKEAQQKSKEELQNKNPKKSMEQQKKSISKMKEMEKEMESMQSSMEMEMDMQNLESLRQIIHGLIKVSFDQESIMKDFSGVQQTDPKYILLSQDQLKLKDDAKILEDSLLALSKKDAFMGSIVTKEVGELNSHIDKSVENIKERRKANASSEMQFSMTSMNNLALMLNDHYNMMMDMMANAQPGSSKKKKKGQQPSLGKMQEMLNQKMEEIKKGGKSGRQLSEEMAQMAAEQERIRRSLQEMQEKLKQNGGQMPGGDLPGKMEQTEFDLVNKQITEQTIKRQKEILTRLLDAEKSMREQDQDEERKGETAKDYGKEIPREFEEYLKLKEKEVELLKTVPPKLFPYYKKEVNEYFKRIGTQD
ncbi:MAG: hypothetical protein RI909_370 [Bacteroidota bacterium]|jgi:hypothetical protein